MGNRSEYIKKLQHELTSCDVTVRGTQAEIGKALLDMNAKVKAPYDDVAFIVHGFLINGIPSGTITLGYDNETEKEITVPVKKCKKLCLDFIQNQKMKIFLIIKYI